MGKQRKTLARAYCHKHTQVESVDFIGNITQVSVVLDVGGLTLRGYGLTRCGNGDLPEYGTKRGFDIARGRANKAIAVQLVRTEMRPWATA